MTIFLITSTSNLLVLVYLIVFAGAVSFIGIASDELVYEKGLKIIAEESDLD